MKPFSLRSLRGLFFVCDFLIAPMSSLRYAFDSSNGVEAMPTPEYSLPDVLERLYHNQLAIEAALMELTQLVETQGHVEAGDNVRGALEAIGENAGHIKQGLARLKLQT